jgi:hypothetical protein
VHAQIGYVRHAPQRFAQVPGRSRPCALGLRVPARREPDPKRDGLLLAWAIGRPSRVWRNEWVNALCGENRVVVEVEIR